MKNLFLLSFITLMFFSCVNNKKSKNDIEPATITTKDGQITSVSGDFKISGIYPHLTTYTHARINGKQSYIGKNKERGQGECGIGAIAEWNNKLYMINYGCHEPHGSEHKLYIIDEDMNMKIFQESVGGTPAARMIHKESKQLFIGHYAIDSMGNIRVINIEEMPGRLTAIARHLQDPENMIYYYDMEGMLYEVNVHSLEPKLLYKDPLPGWHGKGAYTSQNLLVMANNGGSNETGELWEVDTTAMYGPEKHGVLASYNSEKFKVIERKQYTDVTTKHGIHAIPNDQSPLWSIGWDKRSLRLKVLDDGKWHTYLLPKAAYNNDPSHGWFTEWPRIREIHNGTFMMDIHGMFFDFPSSFSSTNTAGLRPISSHLRYIPDFTHWNGQLVLATDETSIQGNPLAGQAQSNLWFGDFETLKEWGPASAYSSVWLEDNVPANDTSLPFMFGGFGHRMLHIINHGGNDTKITLQFDKAGNNKWDDYKSINVQKGQYIYHIFNEDIESEWIRLINANKSKLTTTFHYTGNTSSFTRDDDLFKGLAYANSNDDQMHARQYSNHDNFNMTVFTGKMEEGRFKKEKIYEVNKYTFSFEEGLQDSTSLKALKNEVIWSEDEASAIIETKDSRLRLPKGEGNYYPEFSRNVREVESERVLANVHGTFYEVPLKSIYEEPLYEMMRPVATHNRRISDYNTWNGLFVMSGVNAEHSGSPHIIKNETGNVALWIGGIDDIWKLGKPIGVGGPWKNTEVKAGERSDRYLMKGYDEKSVSLKADKKVNITLYVHTTHYSDVAVPYKTFEIKSGETLTHKFPEGYSAHWITAEADEDCKATVWFKYE